MAEELRIARDEAQRRSRVDALTEVFNRAHFVEELTHELDRAAREGETPAVLMLDLDHFKRVNDHVHGTPAATSCCARSARRIAAAVRGYDTVGALGRRGVRGRCCRRSATTRRCAALAEHVRLAIRRQPFPFGDDAAGRDGLGRCGARRHRAVTADVAGRRRRPGAVLGEAPRPRPAATVRRADRVRLPDGGARGDPHRAGAGRSRERARGRLRPHCAQVADLAARVAEQLVAAARRGPAAAGSAAGCTTSARSRSPTAILTKAGPLTDDEWAVMRTHAALGGEIVRPHPRPGRRRAGRAPPPRALRRRRLPGRAGAATRSRSRRASSAPSTRGAR